MSKQVTRGGSKSKARVQKFGATLMFDVVSQKSAEIWVLLQVYGYVKNRKLLQMSYKSISMFMHMYLINIWTF